MLKNNTNEWPRTHKKGAYTVWSGLNPGVYDTWEDAKAQVIGVKGARFKGFDTREDAELAFELTYEDFVVMPPRTSGRKKKKAVDLIPPTEETLEPVDPDGEAPF
jgi:ribonuclease HI